MRAAARAEKASCWVPGGKVQISPRSSSPSALSTKNLNHWRPSGKPCHSKRTIWDSVLLGNGETRKSFTPGKEQKISGVQTARELPPREKGRTVGRAPSLRLRGTELAYRWGRSKTRGCPIPSHNSPLHAGNYQVSSNKFTARTGERGTGENLSNGQVRSQRCNASVEKNLLATQLLS